MDEEIADSGPGPVRTDAVDADQLARAAQPRRRRQEFLLCLKHLARAYPERQLYPVKDNDATHKKAEVRSWPAKILVFICISRPPHLMDEPCGGVVQNIRTAGHPPRIFGSAMELNTKIRAFINMERPLRAVRLNHTANQVLTMAKRKDTSITSH
ncbi:hypothetical protein GXW84_16085 [Rhodococcus sp. IEGM 248]|uniref:hypothetical protein n=1 Tax=Rhodococcus opacus TaxID=37919 RepID=UPI0013C034E1|nr:hypothetical protein [Rhodococcus opacus]MDV7085659.1 hypothetical protein [Rhodococcus opacus]NDV06027.1 hypothetical protein [Rhodococcus sp. IEGM 248]